MEYVCHFIPFLGVFTDATSLCVPSFLRDLKEKCLSKPGNPEFWSDVKKVGRHFSLISKGEAKKQGSLSSIADVEAEEVRSLYEVSN